MVSPSRLTFPELPPEMRQNILRFLDRKSLLAACRVSRTWLRVISPASAVWDAASRKLGILIADGIEWKMCRNVFLRLAQRWSSILKHCSFVTKYFYGYYEDAVTAIYYHNGKLATSFQSGTIGVWNCAHERWMWFSKSRDYEVTSIKLDDRILVASHANGGVTSWEASTGLLAMIYYSPCTFTRTVDYLSEANLVFSADSRMVAWTMSSGRLVLAEDLKEHKTTGLLVAPYPGEENSIGTNVQKLLVACRTQDLVVLWEATSKVNAEGSEMGVSVKIFNVIRVSSPNGCPCSTPFGDQFHYDGHFLYFPKHGLGGCNGVVSQYDVAIGRPKADVVFRNPIRKLVGVGKKYMLVIVWTGSGDQMDVIERESGKFLIRVEVCRKQQFNAQPQMNLFCIGRRSWLDGFDGNNDQGEIYFYVTQPNSVSFLEWNDRRARGFREYRCSGRVGRGNYRGRPRSSRRGF